MTTNEYERDLNDTSFLKRPGRIDLRVFQNTPDAGDGHPGLQKCFRNYLHEGGMEKDLDMNNKGIINLYSINNIYFCSTQTEITNALTDIGSGGGIIILNPVTINLSSTINISGGGSYIIQAQGDKAVIDCGGNRTAFNITSAISVILRDFKIDANDLTTATKEIINITEVSDNPVMIENVTIVGHTTNKNGQGIKLNSDNCIIKKCNLSYLDDGINIHTSFDHLISGNNISNCDGFGVLAFQCGRLKIIAGNYITGSGDSAIRMGETDNSVINGNICNGNHHHGIYLHNCDNNSIVGNVCNNNDTNNVQNRAGIWLFNYCDNNSIVGNVCNNNNNSGGGTGYGIRIDDNLCDDNTVVGNTCLGNDAQYHDGGTGTVDDSSDGTTNANLNNFG